MPAGCRHYLKKTGSRSSPLFRSDRGDITYIDSARLETVVRAPKETALPRDLRTPSLNDIAAEECFATIDGARMRYLKAGSGPPLILLHGLMGYSFSWRFNLPALDQHSTVYAVDLRGS